MLDPVEAFLAPHPEALRAICRRLRALVRQVVPHACETVYARHNYIAYSPSGNLRKRILYICPVKDWVRLGFDYGGRLADPDHLVEGAGLRLRHVKIRTLEEASNPALEPLVKAAWQAGEDALARPRTRRGNPGAP
jgi:hypothetical protein